MPNAGDYVRNLYKKAIKKRAEKGAYFMVKPDDKKI